MAPHSAPPAFSFPRTWCALAVGVLLGLTIPALAPQATSHAAPRVAPAASEQAQPADSQPDASQEDGDDPAEPYSDDDPDEA